MSAIVKAQKPNAARPRPRKRTQQQTEQLPVVCKVAPRRCADLRGLPGVLHIDRKGSGVVEVQFDPEDDDIQSATIYPGSFMQTAEAVVMVSDGPWKFTVDWDAEGDEPIEGEIVQPTARPKTGHLRLLPPPENE